MMNNSHFSRTRIKFCGLTCEQDIQVAASLGVDAVGLVFYPSSPRAVTPETARALIARLPAFVTTVALVVNPSIDVLIHIVEQVAVDIIQFHGDESPEVCRLLAQQVGNKRWIKALQVQANVDITASILAYQQAGAAAVLLDAWHDTLKGGTGHTFDWSLVPETTVPIILAGGLTADNVQTAINTVQPFAVDVSGGIEASKGVKHAQKMQDFVTAVMC